MEKEADFVKNWEECIYCGSHDNIQMDHVKPKSKGGVTVVPACQECNQSKRDKTLLTWLREMKEILPKKWDKICRHNKRKRHDIAVVVRKVRDEKPKKTKIIKK